MVGGLSARSWPQVEVLFPYAMIGLFLACLGAKRLTILSLGDETAKGLGLKVDLLDNGEARDADSVIEDTSREIERAQDDRQIYARHNVHIEDDSNDTIDLTEEETEEALTEDGISITEGDDDNVDLGEEL